MSIRDLYCWIIPARAGPTTRCITVLILRTDHPRSCGANGVVAPSPYMASGSSPLVRGQPASRARCRGARRIIPARAGPTVRFALGQTVSKDHPRSCGANRPDRRRGESMSGSSPLVRGQPQRHRRPRPVARIIPARAGPTNSNRSPRTDSTDHPRSCGANCDSGDQLALRRGSSPLVRGQPSELRGLPERFRIIPARAGPTHRPHT